MIFQCVSWADSSYYSRLSSRELIEIQQYYTYNSTKVFNKKDQTTSIVIEWQHDNHQQGSKGQTGISKISMTISSLNQNVSQFLILILCLDTININSMMTIYFFQDKILPLYVVPYSMYVVTTNYMQQQLFNSIPPPSATGWPPGDGGTRQRTECFNLISRLTPLLPNPCVLACHSSRQL